MLLNIGLNLAKMARKMSKFVMYLDTNLDYPGLQRLFQAFKMPGQKASKRTKLEPLLRTKNNTFLKMCGSCLIRNILIAVEYRNCPGTLDVYLSTFSYLDGANSIKTDLHICNLWTGQFVSYKSVIYF